MKKPLCGIVVTYLSDFNPRGVVRLAHAFIERAILDDRFEYVALDSPRYAGAQLVFTSEPLGNWWKRFNMEKDRRVRQQEKMAKKQAIKSTLSVRLKHFAENMAPRLPRRTRLLAMLAYKVLYKITSRIDNVINGCMERAAIRYYLLKTSPEKIAARPPVLGRAKRPLGNVVAASIVKFLNLDVEYYVEQEAINFEHITNYIGLNDLDHLIINFPFENTWEYPLELAQSVNVIGWFHDAIPLRLYAEPPHHEHDFYKVFMRMVPLMVLRASQIFAISQSALEDLNSYFPQSKGKEKLIYLGYDEQRFGKHNRPLIERYNLDYSRPIIMFVGGIERRKNVDNIFLAIRLVCRRQHAVKPQFVFSGETRFRHHFADMFDSAQKYADLIETGYITDTEMSALLAEASILLLPSLWEGFGIPILEGFASDCVVITSDVSSMPEVGGEAALYCDPYDAGSIADQIEKALAMSHEERERRLQLGHKQCQKFTWDKMYADASKEMLAIKDNTSIAA